jgi:AcrR family transcriptional regulator
MPRTRSFDKEVALDQAMRLFWSHGYEGTSIDDLTKTLGIAKPSLYAAFGNKRELFEQTLARYGEVMGALLAKAFAEHRSFDVARVYLMAYVDKPADLPRGCLLVQGALACSTESADVQASITEHRQAGEHQLAQRLARAHKEGDLPPDAKPADLARYLSTVAHGLAVQATAGVTAAQMRRVVEVALMAWPTRS